MPTCTGIIAEYNPFHNGHLYQLHEASARTNAKHTIIIMSGDFVQRGDVAITNKHTRARHALENGASIVFELPTLFALTPAERFARGAVASLESCGMVSHIAFGSEEEKISLLEGIANRMLEEDEAMHEKINANLQRGQSYPAAYASAFAEDYPQADIESIISSPNNILALEYIKALLRSGSAIKPGAIKRIGNAHDAYGSVGSFASASAIRNALFSSQADFDFSATVPKNVYADIHSANLRDISMLSPAIIYRLRSMANEEIAALPDVIEGLENVLYNAARSCTKADDLLMRVKSKRYTLARLRRTLIHALLGITKDTLQNHPAPRYLKLLGVRKDALGLLGEISTSATLPIVSSKADYDALDPLAQNMFDFDIRAGEIAALAAQAPEKCTNDFARKLLIV